MREREELGWHSRRGSDSSAATACGERFGTLASGRRAGAVSRQGSSYGTGRGVARHSPAIPPARGRGCRLGATPVQRTGSRPRVVRDSIITSYRPLTFAALVAGLVALATSAA